MGGEIWSQNVSDGTGTRGGGAVTPCPLCLRPCRIHRPTYIHWYVNTLLSVSVILLHFPSTYEPANTHAYFLCVLTFLPQSVLSHSQSVPPTKRPHPHRFSQQSEPFGVSTRGLSQPQFGQQRRLTSLWLPWAIFGFWLDIGKVNSPQSQFAETMWRHSLLLPPGKKTKNTLACIFTVGNVLGTWQRTMIDNGGLSPK